MLSLVLVLCLYAQGLTAPFLYDDLDQIVNNPNLGSWHAFAGRFLLHPVDLATTLLPYAGSIYRPVFWMSLFVDRSVYGLHPAGFHLTNLFLHLVSGNLVFALLRRSRLPTAVAAVSALLWLALPVNTEVVAWVSARSYELCALFTLVCLLSALRYVQVKHVGWALLCFLAAACAALSHELGIVVLPLLLLLSLGLAFPRSKDFLVALGAVVLALLGVAALRAHAAVHTYSALASPTWALAALGRYLALLLLPLQLSVERSTSVALGQPHPWLVCGGVLLLLAAGCAGVYRRTRPAVLGGLLWFLLCMAPFVLLMNYQGTAERFPYLASMGLVTALVTACFSVQAARLRQAVFAGLAAWCAFNVLRSAVRVADWTDPIRLYRASLAATPKSVSLHYNLAFSLREQGQLEDARTEYQHVLAMQPSYPHAYASLGDVYLALHAFVPAQEAYGKALAQEPKDTAVLLNSATAYQSAGDAAAAEATFQRVLQLDPGSSAAHVDLGVLYMDQKRTEDAMHQFATAIDLKTKDPVPFYDLGVIFQQAGRGDLAAVLYRKVLELKPDDEDALRNLQLLQQRP